MNDGVDTQAKQVMRQCQLLSRDEQTPHGHDNVMLQDGDAFASLIASIMLQLCLK